MKPRRFPTSWAILALIVCSLIWWRSGAADRHDLLKAVARGQVALQIISGPEADTVSVTVTRTRGAGAVDLVLPAGAVLGATGPYGQRLVLAHAVIVHIPKELPSQTLAIEVYCLDPFKAPPPPAAPLSLSAGAGAAPSDPVAKLIGCLRGDDGSHRDRQTAVWLVEAKLLDQDFAQARTSAKAMLREEMDRELAETFRVGLPARLRASHPGIRQSEIDREVARFTPAKVAGRLDAEAERLAGKTLSQLKLNVAPLLGKCGYDTAKLRLFQTAPE